MSNFFQRLASQQLDPDSVRVRPMARLPYQAVPEFTEEAIGLDTHDGPTMAAQPGSRPTHPSEPAPSTSRHPSEQAQPTSAPAPLLPDTDHAATAAPSTGGPTPHGEPPVQAATGITTHPAEASLPLPSPLLMEIPAVAPGIAVSNEASPPAAGSATRSANAFSDASADTATDGLPAPLLPRQQTTKAPTAPHVSPEPRRGAGDESAEPNEVHVHIGRIEVTAIQDPPQTKSRPKRGQAPMTLDDYLARRQRGGT